MTSDDDLTRDLQRTLGTKELADRVRQSIVRLRDGAGGEQLAEMACDLLAGRTDLRTISRTRLRPTPHGRRAAVRRVVQQPRFTGT